MAGFFDLCPKQHLVVQMTRNNTNAKVAQALFALGETMAGSTPNEVQLRTKPKTKTKRGHHEDRDSGCVAMTSMTGRPYPGKYVVGKNHLYTRVLAPLMLNYVRNHKNNTDNNGSCLSEVIKDGGQAKGCTSKYDLWNPSRMCTCGVDSQRKRQVEGGVENQTETAAFLPRYVFFDLEIVMEDTFIDICTPCYSRSTEVHDKLGGSTNTKTQVSVVEILAAVLSRYLRREMKWPLALASCAASYITCLSSCGKIDNGTLDLRHKTERLQSRVLKSSFTVIFPMAIVTKVHHAALLTEACTALNAVFGDVLVRQTTGQTHTFDAPHGRPYVIHDQPASTSTSNENRPIKRQTVDRDMHGTSSKAHTHNMVRGTEHPTGGFSHEHEHSDHDSMVSRSGFGSAFLDTQGLNGSRLPFCHKPKGRRFNTPHAAYGPVWIALHDGDGVCAVPSRVDTSCAWRWDNPPTMQTFLQCATVSATTPRSIWQMTGGPPRALPLRSAKVWNSYVRNVFTVTPRDVVADTSSQLAHVCYTHVHALGTQGSSVPPSKECNSRVLFSEYFLQSADISPPANSHSPEDAIVLDPKNGMHHTSNLSAAERELNSRSFDQTVKARLMGSQLRHIRCTSSTAHETGKVRKQIEDQTVVNIRQLEHLTRALSDPGDPGARINNRYHSGQTDTRALVDAHVESDSADAKSWMKAIILTFFPGEWHSALLSSAGDGSGTNTNRCKKVATGDFKVYTVESVHGALLRDFEITIPVQGLPCLQLAQKRNFTCISDSCHKSNNQYVWMKYSPSSSERTKAYIRCHDQDCPKKIPAVTTFHLDQLARIAVKSKWNTHR